MAHVVVVGAGIAGLAAAHAIAQEDPAIEITVVDGARRIGGKLSAGEIGGTVVDAGAEAMLARAPEGVDLARAVGLGDDIVHPATGSASLAVDGALRPIPGGTVMGVPADLAAVAAAGVLTDTAMRAVSAEPEHPGAPVTDDVSVGDLVGSRLGAEVVDRLVDPLLGGVYAGRAGVLSLQATVPTLASAMREHGSVVAAARAALAATPRRDGPVFATLRTGLGTLPEVVARASGAKLRLGLPVRLIQAAGAGFRVVLGPVPAPTVLDADAVIVAVPAQKAAGMLGEMTPWAAHELSGIDYASTALVTLAYPGAERWPAGSGVLVAPTENRAVKALTFSSQKWAHLAGGPAIARASVARHGEERVLQRPDDELADLVMADVAALTGVATRPAEVRVTRWGGALPQYAVGHLDRVRRIRAEVDRVPGLAVCGAAYDGVGVPACIRTGRQAASRVLAHLAAERQSEHG